MNSFLTEVRGFTQFIANTLIPYLENKVNNFHGGQVSHCLDFWRQLTSDRTILQTVSGEIMEFIGDPPTQTSHPPNSVCKGHTNLLAKEIKSLVSKNVLRACNHTPGEFISPIFTVSKKDGGVRLILNLKKFNSFVENYHFKMDNINTILELITPNCWMAVIDLKDAYYSVPIHPKFRKYLRFIYGGQLYEYTVFPMVCAYVLVNSPS